jgi:hypothetical protein
MAKRIERVGKQAQMAHVGERESAVTFAAPSRNPSRTRPSAAAAAPDMA